MRSALRHPALHFFLIGGLLFVSRAHPDADAVATPTTDTRAAAPSDHELWIAEAYRRGLQHSDPVVRRRLARNMRFLAGGDARGPDGRRADERDDEALVEEALRLGMDRSDPVVRRRLVQSVKLAVSAAARAEEPSEAELQAYLERHRARYRIPARVRLSHVYLSRDRRGASLFADAAALRAELVEKGVGPEAAVGRGDPLLVPAHLPSRSEAGLARDFGVDFAREVTALAPGAWSQPVASAYGLHLVWVHERVPAQDPPLEAVRSAVRESLLAERAERAVARTRDELRRQS